MSASTLRGQTFSVGYSLLFFGFLFGPLIIMTITAFNSSSFPRISPWECFTTEWFGVLVNDRRLMGGLVNSIIIGAGVVALSVPVGLAGALALAEIGPKLRSALYTVLITPILIPGVVLGISTIVFWGHIGRQLGFGYDSVFFNGMFLTIAGQVTFISAYAMLIFSARLQRFDPTLTEAALDLGATPGQAFRKIMLPFLRPAILSAAFLTLLASFENYNTTVFTILAQSTFTTALASKVRYGIDPSLSALAVIIIAVTLIGAMIQEAHTRRREAIVTGRASRSRLYGNPIGRFVAHPATIGLLLIALAAVAIWRGSLHDATVCKQEVIDEKRANQQRFLEEQQKRMKQNAPAPQPAQPGAPQGTKNPSPFGGAFGNVAPQSPDAAPPGPPPAQNPSPFGGAFQGLSPPKQ
ncbi:ABC transporter permease [Flaviflagellibacter deserti]|uniref:ABC transporter permease n=1 Tax=Flaviflagellibacter deserti TaxID=2267266 RepID=A0ABV9YY40_9HYPH